MASGCSETPDLAVAQVESPLNGAGVFERVADFGGNPGTLVMYRYVPPDAPANAPLVVAMHACSQNAAVYRAAGWEPLADEFGFYVLYPEQTSQNNGAGCFNWAGEFGNGANMPRGDGENQSIKNMIDHMKANYDIDDSRVFATGHSGGAAQSALMLATWPDVFAGGAMIAGIPYRCTDQFAEVTTCLSPGIPRDAQTWGQYVRDAYPEWDGPWPKVSIWHGTADFTVNIANSTEMLKQWSNVHGIGQEPSGSEMVEGHLRETYEADGEVVIERYTINGGGHGTFVDPDRGCGSGGPFFVDNNICSTRRIADFFGLTGDAPPPMGDRQPPTVEMTAPADGATVSDMVTVSADADDDTGVAQVEFFANGNAIGVDDSAPYSVEWDAAATPAGEYTLRAVARDEAGNEAADEVSVTVDSDVVDETPPTVEITRPADGMQVNGLVSLVATAADDTGVTSVVFLVDDAEVATLQAPPYQTQWDAMGSTLGMHTLTARATDGAGNTAEDTINIEVVDQPVMANAPTVKVTTPADGADVAGVVAFVIEAESPDSPLTQSVLFWDTEDRGEVGLSIDRAPPFDFLWDVRQVERGPHDLIVRVFNQAGGVGEARLSVNVVDEADLPDPPGAGGAGGEAPPTTTGDPVPSGRRYFGCQSSPTPPFWIALVLLGLRREFWK